MKRKRKGSTSRHPKSKTTGATSSHAGRATAPEAVWSSSIEEAFFRTGAEVVEVQPPESFADLDEGYRRPPGLFQRLFARRQAA